MLKKSVSPCHCFISYVKRSALADSVELIQSLAPVDSIVNRSRRQISSLRAGSDASFPSSPSSTYRVGAIRSVPSPSPRGCNRATLLDLDAAMRTVRRGRDATHARRGPFFGSVERRIHVVRPGTETHCMMKVSSAPRGRWGRTWSLSLPLLHARSLPPPPLAARSLARSRPLPPLLFAEHTLP